MDDAFTIQRADKSARAVTALEFAANGFAATAHAGQVRKYTGRPYISHPAAVVDIVAKAGGTPGMLAAAWLHDVVEDCGVTVEAIRAQFGDYVACLVDYLTDPEAKDPCVAGQNRASRKEAARRQLAVAPAQAKTIKLADMIDNTSSIELHDPQFWKVYKVEKKLLMPCLVGGDQRLWMRAAMQCGYSS